MSAEDRVKQALMSKGLTAETAEEIVIELAATGEGLTLYALSQVQAQATPIGCVIALFSWAKSKLGKDHWERRYKEVETAFLAENV